MRQRKLLILHGTCNPYGEQTQDLVTRNCSNRDWDRPKTLAQGHQAILIVNHCIKHKLITIPCTKLIKPCSILDILKEFQGRSKALSSMIRYALLTKPEKLLNLSRLASRD